ncbi:MAG: BrxA family protein, partial [Acidimicrobiales bacterium]
MLSSHIVKGGALLEESRILVERWDLGTDPAENLGRLLDCNVLAKRSRSRATDVLRTVLRPRLVEPGPQVISALRELVDHPRGFAEACYFEACRSDGLLAAFAQEFLWSAYQEGRSGVTVADAGDWLARLHGDGRLPAWSSSVCERTAQGLLATTRDFGVLRGAVRKELAPPRLTPTGFAYVAFRLHQASASVSPSGAGSPSGA